jgi:outer membrane protein assembly factor BamB
MSNPSTPPSEQATRPAQPAARRPILPIVIVAVETVALMALEYAEQAEWLSPANAFLTKFSTAGVTVILLFLWFVFLSPVSRKVRTRVGIIGAALVALAFLAFRIEGVTGDILPRLQFRWSRHADQLLAKIEPNTTSTQPVDLNETTPEDYPQFLGPDRRATLANIKLARDWTAKPPKLLWRQPIGAAWSSFAVVGPFAVTQEQRDQEELITCYEVATGKARWAHSIPVRFEETLAGIGPRATPTIHEGKVYAMGAMGHLTCLDGATGRQLWQHDVVTTFQAIPPIWGKSCSPLIHDSKVIVSAGGTDANSLVAFDKNSGKLLWTGGDDASSYSSPVLMTFDEVPQIVIVNAKSVASHDPAGGRVLWQHPWPGDEAGRATPTVAQPVAVGGDRILLTKGYGTGSALWHIRHDGPRWTVDELWRNNSLKTKFTNAVLRDGFAYALDEGILQCVEVDSGRRVWKRGKYGHGQVLLVDDLLLVQSEAGDIALVDANPKEFHELARISAISGTSWNPPALSGRKLLVRSNLEAACYELPAGSP